MPRIFVSLATLNALGLLATFVIGFLSQGRAEKMFAVHLIGGLFTTVFTLLVHSLAYTYFMGTGRWVQEVVEAYKLPDSLFQRSRTLKSRTFVFVLVSTLLVIATVTCGAASDRGMLDVNFHLVLSVIAIAFNFWSYLFEFRSIRSNGELLDQVMHEVRRIRKERGLA